jgi:hypothetical protein
VISAALIGVAPGGALFAKLAKGDVVIAPKLDRLFARPSTPSPWSRAYASAASRSACSTSVKTFPAMA